MQRNLPQLSRRDYDVAIIGGGIYGAFVAWDAVLRGLSVALVDQGDFGNATSANSQKIIHGGLRYLQHADFKRMRESIRERSALLRIAPHLVHPVPFLLPTYGYGMKGRWAMLAALKLNDLISFDRNRYLEPDRFIPGGRTVSKADCLRLCPDLDQRGLSGGALFYDGQVHNPDRLNLSVLHSAVEAGADLANYVKATGFLRDGKAVVGIHAKDVLTGNRLELKAKVVVNCSGPWLDRVHGLVENMKTKKRMNWFKAILLATRPLVRHVGVGVPCRYSYKDNDAIASKGYRMFFITPWRNTSLVGTFYAPYDGDPDNFGVTQQDISNSINEFNAAYPKAKLQMQDVCFVYGGLLPTGDGERIGDIQYAKHYKIYDHAADEGIQGLISVMGVKYTTARDVAERVVDQVQRKLNEESTKCQTNVTSIYGGAIPRLNDYVKREMGKKCAGVHEATLEHLISTYGSKYQEILDYRAENEEWIQPIARTSPVIKAELLHGVRAEMAQRLGDVIFRRTELGTAGYPGDSCLKTCATIMAEELGWNEARTQSEVREVKAKFSKWGLSNGNK